MGIFYNGQLSNHSTNWFYFFWDENSNYFVQVKTLSLVAYFVRLYTSDIMQYSDQLLLGMLNMLRSCPPEATPFRKELIIAVRHISNTDLKQAFVPHLEQLFNDEILFGSGLTVKENLRPLGYHVIAELVHQLRNLLPYTTLTAATHAFLTNLHDDTLQWRVRKRCHQNFVKYKFKIWLTFG